MARCPKPWFRKQTGWWMVVIRGQRIALVEGVANEQAARTKFHQLMANLPDAPDDPQASVASICEAFLDWSNRHQASATFRGHQFYLNSFDAACGDLKVSELRKYHITKWLDGHAWNETSRYNGIKSAVRAFNWAIEENYLTESPLKGIKRPQPRARQRCLTPHEYRALMASAKRPMKIFLFALRQTGARPGELRQLTWDQVHEDRLVIHQHKTSAKTGKSRVIYLTLTMVKLLAVLQKKSQSDHVFVNCHRKPWTVNALRLQMTRLRRKMGLADDVCCYLIRHQFATEGLAAGVDPITLAELLGHTDMTMIRKVYTHMAQQPDHLKAALKKAAHGNGIPLRTQSK